MVKVRIESGEADPRSVARGNFAPELGWKVKSVGALLMQAEIDCQHRV